MRLFTGVEIRWKNHPELVFRLEIAILTYVFFSKWGLLNLVWFVCPAILFVSYTGALHWWHFSWSSLLSGKTGCEEGFAACQASGRRCC